jgi:hypothetical protein
VIFVFNDKTKKLWGGSVLVKSVWCPGSLLYLDAQKFLKILEIFCYYFIDHIVNPFCLDIFSFFNTHDSQVWSFDGLGDFLSAPFTALELFH